MKPLRIRWLAGLAAACWGLLTAFLAGAAAQPAPANDGEPAGQPKPVAEMAAVTAHEGGMAGAMFTADRRWAVTHAATAPVRIWRIDANAPALKKHLEVGDDGAVRFVAISADTKWLLIVGENSARLWKLDLAADPPTAAKGPALDSTADTHCAAFSPDGRRLITGGTAVLRVYPLTDGNADASLAMADVVPAHRGKINVVSFAPNGRWLLSAGDDSQDEFAKLWQIDHAGKVESAGVLPGATAEIVFGAIAPSGDVAVLSATNGFVQHWSLDLSGDTPRGFTVSSHAFASAARAVDVSTDKRELVAGQTGRVMRMRVDYDRGLGHTSPFAPAADAETPVVGVAFVAKLLVAVAFGDGRLALWRLRDESTAAVPLDAPWAVESAAHKLARLRVDLRSDDRDVRLAALDELRDLGPTGAPALPELVEILGGYDTRGGSRLALEAIVGIGPEAIPELVRLLKHPRHTIRVAACHALGWLATSPGTSVPALTAALNPTDIRGATERRHVRMAAVWALGRFGEDAASAASAVLEHVQIQYDSETNASAETLAAIGRECIPALIEALESNVPAKRMVATHALGQMGTAAARALPAVLERLRDAERPIRAAAAGALGKISPTDPAVLDALLERFGEETETVRIAIVESYGHIGLPALEALETALGVPQAAVRTRAVAALATLGEAAIPALTKALDDSSAYVRADAVAALAPFAARVLPQLEQRLHDRTSTVVSRAVEAIAPLGERARPQLVVACERASGEAQLLAVRTLLDLGGPVAPELAARAVDRSTEVALLAIDGFRQMGRDAEVAIPALAVASAIPETADAAKAALAAVGELSEAHVPAVLAMLSDSRLRQPVQAVMNAAPGRIRAAAMPILVANTLADDYNLRGAAISFLEPYAAETLPEFIAHASRLDENSFREQDRIRSAIRSLFRLPLDGPNLAIAEAALAAGVNASDPLRRFGALYIVRYVKLEPVPDTLVAAVATCLSDSESRIESLALDVLVDWGDGATVAVPALAERLKTTSHHSRYLRVIELIGPEHGAKGALVEMLDSPSETTRKDAIKVLTKLGPDADLIGPMTEKLRDRSTYVQREAAAYLEMAGPLAADAVPALIAIITDDKNYYRAHACRALGAIGPAAASAIPILLGLADAGGETATAAVRALGNMGAEAIEPLSEFLYSDDINLRTAAIEGLADAGKAAADLAPVMVLIFRRATKAPTCEAALRALAALEVPAQTRAELILARLSVTRETALRRSLLDALGTCGDAAVDAVPQLIEFCDHYDLRTTATAAIAKIGAAALPAIIASAKAEAGNRARAITLIGEIGQTHPECAGEVLPYLCEVMNANEAGAYEAAQAIVALGPPARPVLKDLLRYNSRRYRSVIWQDKVAPLTADLLPDLLALLDDGNTEVARYALGVIGELGAEAASAIPALARKLSDRALASSICAVLRRMGPAAKAAILDVVIQVDDSYLRNQTLEAIGTPDASLLPQIIERFAQIPQADRWRIVEIVGQLGAAGAPALPLLIESVTAEDITLAGYAIVALGEVGQATPEVIAAIAAALDRPRTLVEKALGTIAKLGRPAVGACVEKLSDIAREDFSSAVSVEAFRLLALAPELAYPLAIERFADRSRESREVAVTVAGTAGAIAIPALIAKLDALAWPERQCAAEALGHISDPRAIAALSAAARDSVPPVQMAAIESLAKLGDMATSARPLFLQAVKAPDVRIRMAALQGLANGIGATDDLAIAQGFLTADARPAEIAVAARWLARMGAEGEAALRAPLIDPDSAATVRLAAATALQRPIIDGKPRVETLISALASDNADIRALAAWLLARETPPATAADTALSQRIGDSSAIAREYALDALATIGEHLDLTARLRVRDALYRNGRAPLGNEALGGFSAANSLKVERLIIEMGR